MILLNITNNKIEILSPEYEFKEYIKNTVSQNNSNKIKLDREKIDNCLEEYCLYISEIELNNKQCINKIINYNNEIIGIECYVIKNYELYKNNFCLTN